MTLNPPNLGSLDMDIQVRNNKVEVLFLVDTAEIQSSLQANADLLKTALSQQGLKVNGYNVLIQGNTDHHNAYYSDDNASWLNSRREGGKDENRKYQQEQADGIMDLLKGSRFYPGDRYNRISLFI
jgi:flagellar hook-length control protein FliK